jgi:hypothetical protein
MEYKLITSSSPQGLTNTINLLMVEGWTPVGSHQVVITHSQNRFSGTTHKDTTHETEYSQSMVKKTKTTIEVDISFYHPNDDETNKVYDEEGMREEFEYKLDCLIKNN